MKYYIAIDAGGTKTDSVLFDQEGHVLARDLRRGANAFDLGPMEAAARISGAVEMLQERLSEDAKISGVYGAVSAAHYYPEIARAVSRAAGGAPCQFNGVVYNVMAAVLGRGGSEGRTHLAVQCAARPQAARLIEERRHLRGHAAEARAGADHGGVQPGRHQRCRREQPAVLVHGPGRPSAPDRHHHGRYG